MMIRNDTRLQQKHIIIMRYYGIQLQNNINCFVIYLFKSQASLENFQRSIQLSQRSLLNYLNSTSIEQMKLFTRLIYLKITDFVKTFPFNNHLRPFFPIKFPLAQPQQLPFALRLTPPHQHQILSPCVYCLQKLDNKYPPTIILITMSLIYALVARGNDTILCSYSPHTGNFEQVALDVLKRLNLSKQYGQYGTAKYNFYSFTKENYVFLVMVEVEYEMRIAFGFLKDIQEKFFERYPKQKRDAALPFSLSDFKKILEDRVALFNDKTKVDKFCALQKELSEVQEINLRNLNNAIDRGEKIEILVQKTQVMSDASYDMSKTAKAVKRKMWWKNKKMCLAIILLIIVIGVVIAWIAGAFSSSK